MAQDTRELQAILTHLGPDASPRGRQTVRQAFTWAQELHGTQVRKDGSTVFAHVVSVTQNVLSTGETDPDLVSAALLHDVVEKTPVAVPEIAERFGSRVAALVDAVTNRPGDDAARSAERALECGRQALLLRIADRIDGVRRSSGRPDAQREKFLAESRAVHLPLAERHLPALAATLRQSLESAGR